MTEAEAAPPTPCNAKSVGWRIFGMVHPHTEPHMNSGSGGVGPILKRHLRRWWCVASSVDLRSARKPWLDDKPIRQPSTSLFRPSWLAPKLIRQCSAVYGS
ncbi:hypothetical protein FE257_009717 [Aspergillus nanangensis]|uniref:Uncharacterized protein n=1 Tax=Aspergillus nanangensis TaxID=2582783 RepID=A0AAD4GRP1_ASPNN|nr:hypothetical protein FE257_009717 [Aspergillus nanangensis]